MANYLPPEKTVYTRAEALRWMRDMGWAQPVIDSVLYHDNPTEQRLRDLVYRHGPMRAYEILKQGIDLDGYDVGHQRIQSTEAAARNRETNESGSGRGAETAVGTAASGFRLCVAGGSEDKIDDVGDGTDSGFDDVSDEIF